MKDYYLYYCPKCKVIELATTDDDVIDCTVCGNACYSLHTRESVWDTLRSEEHEKIKMQSVSGNLGGRAKIGKNQSQATARSIGVTANNEGNKAKKILMIIGIAGGGIAFLAFLVMFGFLYMKNNHDPELDDSDYYEYADDEWEDDEWEDDEYYDDEWESDDNSYYEDDGEYYEDDNYNDDTNDEEYYDAAEYEEDEYYDDDVAQDDNAGSEDLGEVAGHSRGDNSSFHNVEEEDDDIYYEEEEDDEIEEDYYEDDEWEEDDDFYEYDEDVPVVEFDL